MDNLPDWLGTLYKDCARPLALVDSGVESGRSFRRRMHVPDAVAG